MYTGNLPILIFKTADFYSINSFICDCFTVSFEKMPILFWHICSDTNKNPSSSGLDKNERKLN